MSQCLDRKDEGYEVKNLSVTRHTGSTPAMESTDLRKLELALRRKICHPWLRPQMAGIR